MIRRPAGPAWRWVGFALGILLLAGAVVSLRTHAPALEAASGQVRSAPSELVIALLLAVAAATGASAVVLQRVTSRRDAVGLGLMARLVAAAQLLNYLPLRPGLAGRAAYLRIVHGIPVAHTASALVEAVVVSLVACALVGGAVLVQSASGVAWPWGVAVGAALLVPALRIGGGTALLAQAVLVRIMEIGICGLRLWLCLRMVGSPIDATAAMAAGCVSVLAGCVPLVPGALGVREWAIGLLGPALHAYPLEAGLAADLVNRAAELVVILPLGGASAWGLWRRARGAVSLSSEA